jgi:hypothetical protein
MIEIEVIKESGGVFDKNDNYFGYQFFYRGGDYIGSMSGYVDTHVDEIILRAFNGIKNNNNKNTHKLEVIGYCPFCGSEPADTNPMQSMSMRKVNFVRCSNTQCAAGRITFSMSVEDWNKRYSDLYDLAKVSYVKTELKIINNKIADLIEDV